MFDLTLVARVVVAIALNVPTFVSLQMVRQSTMAIVLVAVLIVMLQLDIIVLRRRINVLKLKFLQHVFTPMVLLSTVKLALAVLGNVMLPKDYSVLHRQVDALNGNPLILVIVVLVAKIY